VLEERQNRKAEPEADEDASGSVSIVGEVRTGRRII
jgi:hypothetical protein